MSPELDDVDRGILHLLQTDARNVPTREMGEDLGVSASTVHNRIERLEEAGVIRGYHPAIDYERAGFPLYVRLVCRAPPDERATYAREALSVTGVVRVRELVTGNGNLELEAVAADSIDDVLADVVDLGLELLDTDLVADRHRRPFDRFELPDRPD